eukprot:TRINITY_DN14999_c0_g1_i1.p1 TRINITY_DN14999_c0_g1~~TRINITY_DN14999_c0_g1_i1.p1  ORF type:complete len:213 (-),score=28.53 TRINITY_DN14999_c0_g1_i1:831-1469(-)
MGANYGKNGFLCFTISYRLHDKATAHPAQMEDVARAIRWVYDHASPLGGDPERIFLSRPSVGAHLISLATLHPRALKGVGLDASIIKGVVGISGIYSLFNPLGPGHAPTWKDVIFEYGYVRPTFGEDQAAWDEASPIQHVALFPHEAAPPFLLLNAHQDLGLENGAKKFQRKLRHHGFEVKHAIIPATTHGSVTHSPRTARIACAYLKSKCK